MLRRCSALFTTTAPPIAARISGALSLRKRLCDLPSAFTGATCAFNGRADAGEDCPELWPAHIDVFVDAQQKHSKFVIRPSAFSITELPKATRDAIESAMKVEGYTEWGTPAREDFAVAELGVVFPSYRAYFCRDHQQQHAHLRGRLARSTFFDIVANECGLLSSASADSPNLTRAVATLNLRHSSPGTLCHIAAAAIRDWSAANDAATAPLSVVALEPNTALSLQAMEIESRNNSSNSSDASSNSGSTAVPILFAPAMGSAAVGAQPAPLSDEQIAVFLGGRSDIALAAVELDVPTDLLPTDTTAFALRKMMEALAASTVPAASVGDEGATASSDPLAQLGRAKQFMIIAYGAKAHVYLTRLLKVTLDFTLLQTPPRLSANDALVGIPFARVVRKIGSGSEFPMLRLAEQYDAGACALLLEVD